MEKITTFSEYSKRAAETQMESCKGAAYLDAAFIGEVGELCSLYAKSVRGDYDLTDRAGDILDESGDCCWMAAMKTVQAGYSLAELMGMDDLEKAHMVGIACWEGPQNIECVLHEIAFYAVLLADSQPDGFCETKEEFTRNIVRFFAALSVFLDHFGLTLADAMNANIEKLAKRKAHGKIMGSGDHREEQFGDAPQVGAYE